MEGIDQRMLTGTKWDEFLHNKENKTDLISLLFRYDQDTRGRDSLPCTLLINDDNKTIRVSSRGTAFLGHCNHEEAGTRLILHALQSQSDVVVVCKDTDVVILMVWAYHKFNID